MNEFMQSKVGNIFVLIYFVLCCGAPLAYAVMDLYFYGVTPSVEYSYVTMILFVLLYIGGMGDWVLKLVSIVVLIGGVILLLLLIWREMNVANDLFYDYRDKIMLRGVLFLVSFLLTFCQGVFLFYWEMLEGT